MTSRAAARGARTPFAKEPSPVTCSPSSSRPRRGSLRIPVLLLVSLAAAGCIRSEIAPVDRAAPLSPVTIGTLEAGRPAAPADWTVLRVGGSVPADVGMTGGRTKAGDEAAYYAAGDARLSAALPEGWPVPTAPGAIELKRYPPTRQAIIDTDGGEGGAFWPLFRHISRRDIAMTAPVVMTGDIAGEEVDAASMAFLYRRAEQGPTGPAESGVRVEDTAPITVLSIGFLGDRGDRRLDRERDHLDAWLAQQPAGERWVAIGGPRLLGYNGPDIPRSRRWWELQLPLRWIEAPAD